MRACELTGLRAEVGRQRCGCAGWGLVCGAEGGPPRLVRGVRVVRAEDGGRR